MGGRIRLDVLRRGYYPRGGGLIRAHVLPCRLQPVALDHRGALEVIRTLLASSIPRST
jgi:RNA 3'-terminal phosphate cyclase